MDPCPPRFPQGPRPPRPAGSRSPPPRARGVAVGRGPGTSPPPPPPDRKGLWLPFCWPVHPLLHSREVVEWRFLPGVGGSRGGLLAAEAAPRDPGRVRPPEGRARVPGGISWRGARRPRGPRAGLSAWARCLREPPGGPAWGAGGGGARPRRPDPEHLRPRAGPHSGHPAGLGAALPVGRGAGRLRGLVSRARNVTLTGDSGTPAPHIVPPPVPPIPAGG